MDYKRMGGRIKQARKSMHYTQEELSYKVDISVPHISQVENGSKIPSIETLVKLSNALKVSTDELLCDSLDYANHAYYKQMEEELGDCSAQELRIISRMVTDAKRNLRENMDGYEDEQNG